MAYDDGDYFPKRQGDRLPFIENFITVANANLADTGLTSAQMTDLNDDYLELSNDYGAHLAAEAVSRAKTATKNETMSRVVAKFRQLAQVVQHHPGASNALKIELGLNAPPAPHVPVEPQRPLSLVADLDGVGWVTLKWDRNGNKAGTTYIIEMRVGNTGPFVFLTSVTRPKYIDKNRAVGVLVEYRVHAVRRGISSAYSNTAAIYAQGWQTPSLQIAA